MVLFLLRDVIFLYLLAIFHLHYFAGKINLQTVGEIFSQNPQPINFIHPPVSHSPFCLFLSFCARLGDKSSLVEWVLVGGTGWDGLEWDSASNDKWSRLEGTIMASAMAVAFTCDVV